MPALVKWRRDFHAHPELGFQEHRTAAVVAAHLRRLGLQVQEGVAGTGVVGLLEGAVPGRTILVRADMDALPVQEANEAEYRSQVPGVMHACGHDGHTAIGMGVAQLLAGRQDRMAGCVKFVFQPAEEGPGGARPMVEAGVLTAPAVDAALGIHLSSSYPLGQIGVRPGPVMAATAPFSIVVRGKGGHAAFPHRLVDPILAAAHVVTALQSIVSRNLDPLKPGVISVATIHGGTAGNVIPPEVLLTGTIRAFEDGVRQELAERIGAVADGVCRALGAECAYEYQFSYPALVNDAEMAGLVAGVAARLFGQEQVVEAGPVMGGEDMAYFLREVPGCFAWVGAKNSARGLDFPHHHPRFDFDEDALANGVALVSAAALEYLGDKAG